MRFADRRQAGLDLADWFQEWPQTSLLTDPIVLARPRGGVLVGAELARALRAPLDVLPILKIGMPGRWQTPVGALADGDDPVYDRQALDVLGLGDEELAPEVARVRDEVRRRERVFREDRPAPRLADRTVILVDDGLATGSTARAAARHLRKKGPERLILAVPVGSPDTAQTLRDEADDVVCVHLPEHFRSVAQWYDDFSQVSDDEVVAVLRSFD
ncbi:phosphoribosyltransferase [Streptomyces sp. NPDC050560]|uniref:phosphoribosyltransferase n=1 Tax=Streptomyces sp. NPDC050560 TaxID=3365630 RepID=UPI0037BA1F7D